MHVGLPGWQPRGFGSAPPFRKAARVKLSENSSRPVNPERQWWRVRAGERFAAESEEK